MMHRSLLAFVIVAFAAGCQPKPPIGPITGTPGPIQEQQLQALFKAQTSSVAGFATGKRPGDFYMALEVVNDRPNITRNTCLDSNFLDLIRRQIWKTEASSSLVLDIRPPNWGAEPPLRAAIFQTSAKEADNTCATRLLGSGQITPYFRADAPFQVEATAFASEKAGSQVAGLVDTAQSLVALSGATVSGNLLAKLSGDPLAKAARAADSAIAANWTGSNSAVWGFEVSPWAAQGEPAGTATKDQFAFAAPDVVRGLAGVQVTDNLVPLMVLRPRYRTSLFGDGPGRYANVDNILTTQISTGQNATLRSVLLQGVGGFSTELSASISDVGAMSDFCLKLRHNLASFLTEDDALAARYAVLSTTGYMQSAKLRDAPQCFSAGETERLKQLRPTFEFPALAREINRDRTQMLAARMQPIRGALLLATSESLSAILATPATFRVAADPSVRNVLASTGEGPITLVGSDAITALSAAGPIRLACWKAGPAQNLVAVAGVVRNSANQEVSGVLVEFEPADDPLSGHAGLVSLSFYPVDTVRTLLQLGADWAGADCDLI